MEIRIDIASRFLSALICRDPKRSIESRLSEVRHALLLADVLIATAKDGERGSDKDQALALPIQARNGSDPWEQWQETRSESLHPNSLTSTPRSARPGPPSSPTLH